jgi:hypothetical protein
MPHNIRYIVAGTGRNGSVNIARVLTSVGIPCAHERFFDGCSFEEAMERMRTNTRLDSECSRDAGHILPPETEVEAISSYMVVPFLSHPYFSGMTLIHLVRNPIKVILSFINDMKFFHWYPTDHIN